MASLLERTGVLGHRLAAHLLRRATYHPTKALIDDFAAKTPAQAIDDLMGTQNNYVPIPIDPATGLPWLDENGLRYETGPNVPVSGNFGLRNYIRCWWIDEARRDMTIRHKMTFFLHNIWVTSASEGQPEDYWDYLRLLRYYALGSYKELAKKMTINNQMLRYLDNKDNNDNSPNENYSREFLELFTIGKGEQIGPGDYTTYQELDVSEGAKALTGWKIGDRSIHVDGETGIPQGRTNFGKHEESDKVFSSAFQGQTITGAVDENDMFRELDDYVNMVFAQDATAKNICRQLYTFFVSRHVSTEIENDIINPLATTLRDNNYELEPVMRQLLASQHFYDEDDSDNSDEIIGGIIKSPLEHVLGAINYFQIDIPDPVTESYAHYHSFYKRCFLDLFGIQGGMDFFIPPNVAGYPAYYQEPGFHRNWFNSSTIISRYKLPDQLLEGKRLLLSGNLGGVQFNIVPFIANSGFFSNPGSASTLVSELTQFLFCETPSAERMQYFIDALTGDFDEPYWEGLWINYFVTGEEGEVKSPLEDLFRVLLFSPEFQMM